MTETQRFYRIEVITAILLGLATVSTGWSAYQAVRWSGRQAASYNLADARRSEANRISALASQDRLVDVGLFMNWLSAYTGGREELATFYRKRFRPEFSVVFEKWLAKTPRTNNSAEPSPFSMPEYHVARDGEVARLIGLAADATHDAAASNEQGDMYQLTTVVFGVVLFLAGVVPAFKSIRAKAIAIWIAGFALVGGLAVVFSFPIE